MKLALLPSHKFTKPSCQYFSEYKLKNYKGGVAPS